MSDRYVSWMQSGWAAELGPGTPLSAVPLEVRSGGTVGATVAIGGSVAGPEVVERLVTTAIVRAMPASGSADHPANVFPMVELREADLPWRYSPRGADGTPRPWLALLALAADEYEVAPHRIAGETVACKKNVLPDLSEAPAWAHLQASGVQERARLLCPRVLVPGTTYRAFLVPTFARGRLAGLGEDWTPVAADEPAWGSQPVTLPVYASWSFRAGPPADFEAWIDALRGTSPTTIGWRKVASASLGLPEASGYLPGALVGTVDPPAATRDADLRAALEPLLTVDTSAARPVVGPPLRGTTLTKADPTAPWNRSLNTRFIWRAVAGLGEAVVRANQEVLVASAREGLDSPGRARDDGRRAIAKHLARRRVGAASEVAASWAVPLSRALRPLGLPGVPASTGVPDEVLLGAARRALRVGASLGRRLIATDGDPVRLAIQATAASPDRFAPRFAALPPPSTLRRAASSSATGGLGRWAARAMEAGADIASARFEASWAERPAVAGPLARALLDDLLAMDAELALPGVSAMGDDRVALLVANAQFVEAFCIGASEELRRELLWREIPYATGQPLLPSFWEPDVVDLPRLGWASGQLGAHVAAPAGLWVLVRGRVIREMPDLTVRAFPAAGTTGAWTPKAGGSFVSARVQVMVDASTLLLGFDLEREVATGEPGYFLVFSEPDAGARFGVDPDASAGWVGAAALGVAAPDGAAVAAASALAPLDVWVHASRFSGASA